VAWGPPNASRARALDRGYCLSGKRDFAGGCRQFTPESPVRFLMIEMIGAVVGVGAIVASGLIADRVGRTSLLMGSAIAIAFHSGFAPQFAAKANIRA
jgi:hypothetical protein